VELSRIVVVNRLVAVNKVRRVRLLSETPFEAGGESAFHKIAGLFAQIFENLVGRDSGHVVF
jgi:hypothetical protein